MSRLLAAIATTLCMMVGAAWAQAPGPAPATHPGTRLSFPPTVGGATFEESSQASANGPASYAYTVNKMQIYVYIFDGGRRVPPGSESPALMTQFTTEVDQAEQQIKTAGYTRYQRPAVPSSCTYGTLTFRCIVYSARAPEGRRSSKLLLTGYRDYFLKIRIDWFQASGQTEADADKALRSFISALVH
jgi:hypothetical protein